MTKLIQFDASVIPSGTSIDSAILRVYLVGSWDYPNKTRNYTEKLTLVDTETIIRQLFEVLCVAGLVEHTQEAEDEMDVPGYSFPRLPLSAYIPGRRQRRGVRDEYLSRPRSGGGSPLSW